VAGLWRWKKTDITEEYSIQNNDLPSNVCPFTAHKKHEVTLEKAFVL